MSLALGLTNVQMQQSDKRKLTSICNFTRKLFQNGLLNNSNVASATG